MAKCSNPNCNSTSFTIDVVTPSTSNFKLLFVCCASCRTTVGVIDFKNIGAVLETIKEDIGKIKRKIGVI